MVVLLPGVLADVSLNHRIQGVILPHLLKMGILCTPGVSGELGEGLVHDDGAGSVVQLQRVLHVRILL